MNWVIVSCINKRLEDDFSAGVCNVMHNSVKISRDPLISLKQENYKFAFYEIH